VVSSTYITGWNKLGRRLVHYKIHCIDDQFGLNFPSVLGNRMQAGPAAACVADDDGISPTKAQNS